LNFRKKIWSFDHFCCGAQGLSQYCVKEVASSHPRK
jgi:hypothetical protein